VIREQAAEVLKFITEVIKHKYYYYYWDGFNSRLFNNSNSHSQVQIHRGHRPLDNFVTHFYIKEHFRFRFEVKFLFLSRPLIFVICLTLELPWLFYLSKLGQCQEDISLLKITMKCGRIFPNGTAFLKNHENLIRSCVVIALQESVCVRNKCTWKSVTFSGWQRRHLENIFMPC
jgi:hypothetical protein